MPTEEQLAIYRDAIFQSLDEEGQWLYDCAVQMNRIILQATLDMNEAESGYHFLREMIGIPKYVPMRRRPFIIYGAGKQGIAYAEALLRRGIDNFIFCDVALANGNINDRKVISPQELSNYIDRDVVISSSRYGWEIYKRLLELGIDKDRIFLMQ